jgi:hypothetical protein
LKWRKEKIALKAIQTLRKLISQHFGENLMKELFVLMSLCPVEGVGNGRNILGCQSSGVSPIV